MQHFSYAVYSTTWTVIMVPCLQTCLFLSRKKYLECLGNPPNIHPKLLMGLPRKNKVCSKSWRFSESKMSKKEWPLRPVASHWPAVVVTLLIAMIMAMSLRDPESDKARQDDIAADLLWWYTRSFGGAGQMGYTYILFPMYFSAFLWLKGTFT